MEDGEGGMSFDFEVNIDLGPTQPTATVPAIQSTENAISYPTPLGRNRRSFRQTVCRHWLRGLCMKGEACGFLHQYDKSRMPVCRFFRLYGECREQDCVYKHTNEDIKECNMYKLGFCPNGPDCRYRHAKLPGPPPPVEEVLQKIQQLTSYSYANTNRFFQSRNANHTQQTEKSQFSHDPNGINQTVKPTTLETPNEQQQQVQQSQQHAIQIQVQNLPNVQDNELNRTATPLPQGISRYFIVKSCNCENLELSVQQGVWATQRSNEAKLNEAFDSVENVILIFSVNRTRHFQGCAKMTSKIGGSVSRGNWKHSHGTAHYGRNFSVKWLKLCELSFHKTLHLKNPYNENLPVKISRDCQELEPSIGEQLASLLHLEPDSELMAMMVAEESKREEEKAKGVDPNSGTDNPDIVPFEDNEEEEEESEEEDESFGQGSFSVALGRGRGRGMTWPPHMGLACGGRPFHEMRGFPPGMVGGDGFHFGGVTPDGFPVPDPLGMAPRPFIPFGPRFSGPPPGMMFHSQPSQPVNYPSGVFGMMMGPGQAPFMGDRGMGSAAGARTAHPVGITPQFYPPALHPSQTSNRAIRRHQIAPANDGNDKFGLGLDQDKVQETGGEEADDERLYQQGEKSRQPGNFGAGISFRNNAR